MKASTETLWRRFGDGLRAFIARRIDNPEDAEDLLQEVFLRIHRHPPANLDRPAAWLFKVTRNLIVDHYRRQKPLEPLPAEEPRDWERFEVRESEQEVARWLIATFDDLPEKYSQAVKMVDGESRSMKEVAQALGLSISGAKSRVQRGRAMLAKALLDCCTFYFDRVGRIESWTRNRDCGCR